MALDRESTLNLDLDLKQVNKYVKEIGGALQGSSEEGIFWLTLHPRSDTSDKFFIKIEWASYPHLPPSVRFVDKVNSNSTSNKAWPKVGGYRIPSDICKAFTAEGFAEHPEWKDNNEAWKTSGNPFWFVASVLQADLNEYQGRGDD